MPSGYKGKGWGLLLWQYAALAKHTGAAIERNIILVATAAARYAVSPSWRHWARAENHACSHVVKRVDWGTSQRYSWYNKRETDYETYNFMHNFVSIDLIISTLRSVAYLWFFTRYINHNTVDSQKSYA